MFGYQLDYDIKHVKFYGVVMSARLPMLDNFGSFRPSEMLVDGSS